MPNPIKGSDLYQDDGALDGAIKKLEQFINKFEEATATVQQKAQAQARAIKESNTAQDRNVEAQAQAAKEADKLARAYQRYETSLSDAGREMARLKEQQRRQNTLLRNQARAAASAEGSYDRLAAQYNLNKIRLNAMSREQREAAEASSQLVTRTRQLFEEMKRLQAETGKTALNVGNYADSLKDAFRETIGLGAGALGPAAIGAALAGGLAAGTQAAIELAEEIRNVKGALSTLVGPNENLEGLTTRVRALATTFDESTRRDNPGGKRGKQTVRYHL
jgi:phage-related tail protein